MVEMGIQVLGLQERRNDDSARMLTRRNGAAADKDCSERYTPLRAARQLRRIGGLAETQSYNRVRNA